MPSKNKTFENNWLEFLFIKHNLPRKESDSTTFQMFFLIISLLQNFCTTFLLVLLNNQNSSISSNTVLGIIIRSFLGVVDLEIDFNNSLFVFLFIVISIYHIILFWIFVNIIIGVYQISCGSQFRFNLLEKLEKPHFYFLSSLIFNFLIGCCFRCWKDPQTRGFIIIFIVMSIMTLLFTLLSYYSELPIKTNSPLSKSNNWNFYVRHFYNVIIGCFFNYFLETPDQMLRIISCVDFIFNLSDIIISCVTIPFFNSHAQKANIFKSSISLGFSTSNLIGIFFRTKTQQVEFCWKIIYGLIFTVFIFKLFESLSSDEITDFSFNIKDLKKGNQYWIIRRVYKFINLLQHETPQVQTQYKIESKMLNMYILKSFPKSEIKLNRTTGNLNLSKKVFDIFLVLLHTETINYAVKINILSVLIEERAYLYELFRVSHKMILVEKNFSSKINIRILQDRIIKFIQESEPSSHNHLDLMTSFHSINCNNDLKQKIETYNKIQISLYSHLEIYNPNLMQLTHLVDQLGKLQVEITKSWCKIETEGFEVDDETLRLYADYLKLLDYEHYQILMARYKVSKNRVSSQEKKGSNTRFNHIPKDRVSFLVNLQPNKFGTIMMCSSNISAHLKYQRNNMIGKSLKNFMPEEVFNFFMKNIATSINERGEQLTNNLDLYFLMDTDGSLKPFYNSYIILNHPEHGLCCWNMMDFKREKVEEFILFDKNGNILGLTSNILRDFEVTQFRKNSMEKILEKLNITKHEIIQRMEDDTFTLKAPNSCVYNCNFCLVDEHFFLVSAKKLETDHLLLRKSDSSETIPEEYIMNNNLQNSKNKSPTKSSHNLEENYNLTESGGISEDFDTYSRNEADLEKKSSPGKKITDLKNSSSTTSKIFTQKKESKLIAMFESMKYSRFNEKYIALFTSFTFIAVYLTSIYLSYSQSLSIIDDVNIKVELFNQVSARSRYTLEVCRSAHANLLYQDFYPNGRVKQLSNQQQMPLRITNLASSNSKILLILTQIRDQDLKARFFEKKVKVYYKDFTNILESDSYSLEDSFSATNLILTQAEFLYKIALNKNEYQQYLMEYMMTNAFNDLAMENEALFQVIFEDIYEQLDDVLVSDLIRLVITIILLLITIIASEIVLFRYYCGNCDFLTKFINPASTYLTSICTDLTSKGLVKSVSKISRKKTNSATFKAPQRREMLRNILLKMTITLLILCCPLILLSNNRSLVIERDSKVRKTLNDLYHLNNIKIHGYYTINLQIMSIIYPNGNSLYTKNPKTYRNQFNSLDDFVSLGAGFSPQTMSYFKEDICQYYIYHPTRPSCANLSNGIGFRGLLSTILSTHTYFQQLEEGLENSKGNATLMIPFIVAPQFLDNFYLISNGVSPAVEAFQRLLTDDLFAYLKNISTIEIVEFFGGIGMGIAIILTILYLMWIWMKKLRKMYVRLIGLVPQEYLVKNKVLKEFLIKQSFEAGMYIKSLEKKNSAN